MALRSAGCVAVWLPCLAHRTPSKRSLDDEAIGTKVRASFIGSARTYGARRVWRDVLADGIDCGLHRIERLIQAQALNDRPRRRGLPKDEDQRLAAGGRSERVGP